jgi:hypothetical protein
VKAQRQKRQRKEITVSDLTITRIILYLEAGTGI